jgi:hypothetical protein
LKFFILKAIIIWVISVSECDQNIKFIVIDFFYNTILIPFFKERSDCLKRSIWF